MIGFNGALHVYVRSVANLYLKFSLKNLTAPIARSRNEHASFHSRIMCLSATYNFITHLSHVLQHATRLQNRVAQVFQGQELTLKTRVLKSCSKNCMGVSFQREGIHFLT